LKVSYKRVIGAGRVMVPIYTLWNAQGHVTQHKLKHKEKWVLLCGLV